MKIFGKIGQIGQKKLKKIRRKKVLTLQYKLTLSEILHVASKPYSSRGDSI